MTSMLECLVEANGKVLVKDGAESYVDVSDSPEKLMDLANEGYLPKGVLQNLLDVERRRAFLDACAVIERKYTEDCTARNDPCLELGCAVEGEICLQPLLRARIKYQKACAAEWIKLFGDPRNRSHTWKN